MKGSIKMKRAKEPKPTPGWDQTIAESYTIHHGSSKMLILIILIAGILALFAGAIAEDACGNVLALSVDGEALSVAWEDNESVRALKELLADGALTISMEKYGGFEQVGSLGSDLPRNDVRTQTASGDIVLYNGNQIVIFYGSNTWAYTRLGKVTDASAEQLEALLGDQSVTLTLETFLVPLGRSGWTLLENGSWAYGDADGNALLGLQAIDGTLYCFSTKGEMMIGWAQMDGRWYYAEPSGAICHSGWTQIGGTWYYFQTGGEMAVGWLDDGSVRYYMQQDGTMATGWIKVNDVWYYFNTDGSLFSGWKSNGNDWYLMKPEMAAGWAQDSGTWYYFKASGVMAANEWILYENQWYWFNQNGIAAVGWQEIDGSWEFFDNSGVWQYTWDGN